MEFGECALGPCSNENLSTCLRRDKNLEPVRIKFGIYHDAMELYDREKILCVSIALDSLFMARIEILTTCIFRSREVALRLI